MCWIRGVDEAASLGTQYLAFHIFETLSRLHIYLLKSVIYLVNDVLNLNELARILCCSIGSSLSGLLLGAKYKSSRIWNGIIKEYERVLLLGKYSILPWEVGLHLLMVSWTTFPPTFFSLFSIPIRCRNN